MRKKAKSIGGGYYTDIKKFNYNTLTRTMYIFTKSAKGNFVSLGSYDIKSVNGKLKASRLDWNTNGKRKTAEERRNIAKYIDKYEKIK